MKQDSIELRGINSGYKPGDAISGAVSWKTSESPGRIEIRLFWFTSGQSLQQIGMVGTKAFDDTKPYGVENFSFALPEGPWSYTGQLSGLHWAIEAVAIASGTRALATFSLGLGERPVALHPIEREEDEY